MILFEINDARGVRDAYGAHGARDVRDAHGVRDVNYS